MPKTYKVKRYRRIYRKNYSPLSIALRALCAVLIVGGLAFVGWSAYGPITDYLSGTLAASLHKNDVSSPPTESVAASSETQQPTQPAVVPETPKPVSEQEIRAIYLPISMLTNTANLDASLEKLQQAGFNALLFDIKEASGKVTFASKLPLVEQAKAQSDNALDLAAFCAKLKEKNIMPIGRFHAFRDPLAARVGEQGIRYMNSDMLWYDNEPESGGKPWLNPYDPDAREYLLGLIQEAAELGVQQIQLDSLHLPLAYMLEYASYGSNATTMTANQALASFVEEAKARVEEQKTEICVYIPGLAALGEQDTYFGGSPFALTDGAIVVGMMPAQFGDGYTSDQYTIKQPLQRPFETVDGFCKALSAQLSGKRVIAQIQGYTATGNLQNNKVYTEADLADQLRALEQNGITNYILYSPDGSYPRAS